MTEEKRQTILRMSAEGKTLKEICKTAHSCFDVVKRVIGRREPIEGNSNVLPKEDDAHPVGRPLVSDCDLARLFGCQRFKSYAVSREGYWNNIGPDARVV